MLERDAGGAWRIVHYSLTFPIPNELAPEFTRRIRELEAGANAEETTGTLR